MDNPDAPTRARRSRAAALIPTTAAVVLATVLFGGLAPARPTASVGAPAPAVTRTASVPDAGTSVLLRLPDGVATAWLDPTPAAQEVAAMLPLRLRLHDPMGQAKSGRLPRPLVSAAPERVLDPEVGGIYYWPPSGDLAVYYDDLGQTVPPPGLVRIGTVTGGLPALSSAGNRFTLTIERN